MYNYTICYIDVHVPIPYIPHVYIPYTVNKVITMEFLVQNRMIMSKKCIIAAATIQKL